MAIHCPRFFPLPLPLLVLAACGEEQSTAPTLPGGAAGSAFSTASLKVVNSLADPGNGICNATQCTLREAIKASGATAITFAPGLTGTITLAAPAAGGGTLQITSDLSVTGPAAGVTIRRRSTDPAFRIMRVAEGATVTLRNLTIRNGKAAILGAGIANFGALALINCTVAGNIASNGGGGIENQGSLRLTHTTVSDNSALFGGGIDNVRGPLVVTNSVIARNLGGGGIRNRGGTLTITNTTVSDNIGGGIGEDRGTSTLDGVRITGNSASGYTLHQGMAKITNSTIARNSGVDGAGLLNLGGGDLTVAKSTVLDNTASGRGGGICNLDDPFGRAGASLRLVNSTITGNSARLGGGILQDDNGSASMTITNSTVASNSASQGGGGIVAPAFEFTRAGLTNTLVALNTAPSGPSDLSGNFDARSSLIGDGAGGDVTNTNGNQVGNVSPNTGPIDPRIGPLADNGGPTRTRALLAGSPAIDAASSDGCPGKDQRGVPRPQGAGCDIGSYERE